MRWLKNLAPCETLRSRRSPAEGKPNYFVLPAGASKALLNALDFIRWAFALVLLTGRCWLSGAARWVLLPVARYRGRYGSCVHGVLPVGSAESLCIHCVCWCCVPAGPDGFLCSQFVFVARPRGAWLWASGASAFVVLTYWLNVNLLVICWHPV